MSNGNQPNLESLPPEMQDWALVPWRHAATLLGFKDIRSAQEAVRDAGIPLVAISERKHLPRWGRIRGLIQDREAAAA